jgi:hypothetical protein
MGEANRRGSFEERKALAIAKRKMQEHQDKVNKVLAQYKHSNLKTAEIVSLVNNTI